MEAVAVLLPLFLFLLFPLHSSAQQPYVDNKQLDCNVNHTNTLGFLCNGASSSCTSYLTFRSTPTYNTPVTIAYLLNADASQIATANNISDIAVLADDTLVIVPVNCSCSQNYYQHNASYVLKQQGETYLNVANDTYQALTTCQALIAQNAFNFRSLYPGLRLNVPLRCACPTRNQTAAGFRYLLTYLIRQGNSYSSIAGEFAGAGADVPGILNANELGEDDLIFFFTPILVPLKTQPTKANINTVVLPPPTPAPPTTPGGQSGGSSSHKWIFIGVGIGAAVLFLISGIFVLWCCFYRQPRRQKPPVPPPKLAEESGEATQPFSNWSISSEGIRSSIETLTIYKFEELEKATESFAESNRINGSSVYRASFKGDNAVVKIMKGDVSGEIDVLRKINHSHIIRLSGFCLHQGITYLVYEYADNGSLDEWLHLHAKKDSDHDKSKSNSSRLDWKQRLQIAYDVADALNYLHNFTNPPHIHKNLTSSNILLDSNMRGKVANFGLSRSLESEEHGVMTRHVVGTYGYMAPEYIESGLITPKLDVFAFGVVMLELLSGKQAIVGGDDDEQLLLAESIQGVLEGHNVREKLRKFMDPWFGEEYPLDLAYSMAQLARSCVAHHVGERPNVSEVFIVLSKLLSSSLDWDPSHDTSISLSD